MSWKDVELIPVSDINRMVTDNFSSYIIEKVKSGYNIEDLHEFNYGALKATLSYARIPGRSKATRKDDMIELLLKHYQGSALQQELNEVKE